MTFISWEFRYKSWGLNYAPYTFIKWMCRRRNIIQFKKSLNTITFKYGEKLFWGYFYFLWLYNCLKPSKCRATFYPGLYEISSFGWATIMLHVLRWTWQRDLSTTWAANLWNIVFCFGSFGPVGLGGNTSGKVLDIYLLIIRTHSTGRSKVLMCCT